MQVLAAPDKFRGTLSAAAAARAIAVGALAAGWTCRELPLADGGEGTLEVLGGANRIARVTGPLGDPVEAGWRLDGATAYVEMAMASGLALVGGADGNAPLEATTRGTGELIAAAAAAGASEIVVGVGGSATTDGGAGALEALGDLVPFTTHGLDVRVACDVTTRFADAASVFAPQKGASPEHVLLLRERLLGLAADYRTRFEVDVGALDGSGAAGGLAGGLAAAGAMLEPGFGLVADLVGLDDALASADLVVTGEGRVDATSFAGKVVGGVLERARARGLPALVVAGDSTSETPLSTEVISLAERFGLERALADTASCVALVVTRHLRA